MKYILHIIILVFVFSCDTPLTQEELNEISDANDSRVKITMDMSTNLELTLGIKNFDQSVSIMSFELIFDPNSLGLNSTSGQKFGDPSFSMVDDISDTTFASFTFIGNISGDGDLLKLSFQGSQSSYKGTTIFVRKIELLDSSGNLIDISDDEIFFSESVCYINEHPTNPDNPSPCGEGGDYCWTNIYCWHANVYNPQP